MAFIEVDRGIRTSDWSMHDLHSHPHYEIYYLTKGSRSFFFSNALYQMEAPVLLVIPPHVMHKTEGGPFERYNVNVSANYLDDFQKETMDKKALCVFKLKQNESASFTAVLDQLLHIDKHQKHGDAMMKALFSYCIFMLAKIDESGQAPRAEAKNSIPPLILKSIDYINENYHEKQTLEKLAKTFFVAKTTLMYQFKKYTNCSMIDYLLNVRLTKAKEMLLNSKKSVGDIAEACGFSSSNYFGLIFKKKENLSPANYRKHQKNKS